jgi:protoporphyrinogen/coproporphyrinogen III oxidase
LIDAERRDGQVLTLWRWRRRRPVPTEIAASGDVRSPFVSLRTGMSTLVTALERTLPAGSIRYERRVERIDRTASGWTVTASGERVDGQAVLIAAPAYAAAALLAPLDAEAARVCADVPYVSTASVALAWPRAAVRHPLSGTGFVVARRHSRVRITACTWVTSKWDHRAPDGSVLVRAFIGGAHDPQVVDLNDPALVEIARRDLRQVLGIAADPVLTRVYRWRNAGAQHIVGHLARMAAIERRLAGHPGLFVAGSGFRSIGIPDCVAHGRMAAEGAVAYVRGC